MPSRKRKDLVAVRQEVAYTSSIRPAYTEPVLSSLRTKYRTDRYRAYSTKLRRFVTFYSTVAYQHWLLIEADPEIETFCEQPLKIKIRLPEGEITTLFDIWIRWKSGKEEFRAIRSLLPDQSSPLGREISAQKRWCAIRAIDHVIVTAETIQSNPTYLANCKFCLKHIGDLRHLDTTWLHEKIIESLTAEGPISFGDLKTFLDIDGEHILSGAICELIVAGRIEASIRTKLLTLKTKLEVAIC
jgi:hypothetical protein